MCLKKKLAEEISWIWDYRWHPLSVSNRHAATVWTLTNCISCSGL